MIFGNLHQKNIYFKHDMLFFQKSKKAFIERSLPPPGYLHGFTTVNLDIFLINGDHWRFPCETK